MLKVSNDNIVALSINILLIRIFLKVYKLNILVNFNWFRFWFHIKFEDLLFLKLQEVTSQILKYCLYFSDSHNITQNLCVPDYIWYILAIGYKMTEL